MRSGRSICALSQGRDTLSPRMPGPLKFHCTYEQLTAAGEKYLRIRNLVIQNCEDATSVVRNLVETVSEASVSIACDVKDDEPPGSQVTLIVTVEPAHDMNDEPLTTGPDFREAATRLHELIFGPSEDISQNPN